MSMELSQELKQRTRSGERPQPDNNMNNKRQKKTAMAKRGLRSLTIALVIPLSLTLANISFFGGSHSYYYTISKPFWFPPLWVLHLMCSAFSAVMGLSAWLVWAEGGFHRKPVAAAKYMGQLALSLAWDPVLFWLGASWVGLVVCLLLLGCVAACYRAFREVNPIAGDLVKPCIAWAGFLTLVNLKLVYF